MPNEIEKKDHAIVKSEYDKEYSESHFWEKVKRYALKAGGEVIGNALTLYYCLKDRDTPMWAKSVIVGALGYFITPLDAIPDITPMVGYADDLGVLAAALATVAVHIKDSHRKLAREQIKKFFSGKEDGG